MSERKDRIHVHIEGKEYSVVGGTFQQMLAAVKQINGRRFLGDLKVWQLPGTEDAIRNQIEIGGYQLEGGAPAAPAAEPARRAASPRPGGDRIRVTVQGHQLAVVGGLFQEMLAAVKNLPGRRFDGNSKIWEIPGDAAVIKQLVETAGFQLEGADKIAAAPAPSLEAPTFDAPGEAPSTFEEPDFSWDGKIPPYEPPDWWDDEGAALPPVEPPDWLNDEVNEFLPDDPAAMFPASELPQFSNVPPAPVSSPAPSSSGSRGGDQIRVRVGGIPLMVSGGTFKEMLAAVKAIPGRRFDGQDKVWDVPAAVTIDGFKQKMAAAGFEAGRG